MRADRLLSIMLILQAQGKTTTLALAETLEVSRRTILRDIEALSIAGVPVHAEAGHGGGVYLDEGYRVSLTGLKEAEVRALFVSTRPGPLGDVGLGQAADATLLKLFAALPSLHRQEARRMQQRIHLDPAWWWHKGEPLPHLETLKAAVFEDYRVRVRYARGDGEVSERILEPYSLVAKASVWYLIARRDEELRTYRVSRFLAVEVLDTHFERDETFDLAQYWHTHSSEFVANLPTFAFTLRLPAARLQFLNWYASGRFTVRDSTPEGTYLVIDLQVSSLDEARMLVLGLGTDAEIIEPDALRNAVLLQAQQFVARFSPE
ncbi:MAG: YafY family transcriptional regulator [Pleurocapsa minor GSE-CHR-MK-17-07R]|nr:YafY family transcriptional regulator [Pleurocapsa minor GSE-CHR-MK 17-07R]